MSKPWKCSATLDGKCSAHRSTIRARLIVRLARFVERLAADTIEAQLGGPGQHQGATARVAIQTLERQALQHGLAAAGSDRESAERIGVLHDGVLRRISA